MADMPSKKPQHRLPGSSGGADRPPSPTDGAPFVGRARELERLRQALDATHAGSGRLVLLAGEPGIGKTRLAERIAEESAQRGAQVLLGRCHEGDGAPAYWPWVMVLRALAAATAPANLRAWLGAALAVVAQVVPELAQGMDVAAVAPLDDAASARFRFFDAVATLLSRAAAERPLVVLLDDLHWADGASLQLLVFAARQLAHDRVLLLGTLRKHEMHAAIASDVRAELARAGQQIDLGGLDAGEVAQVMRAILGDDPPPDVAARIHDVTEGNPFFIDALSRMLASSGALAGASAERLAELPIPDGVRDVVRARLRPLAAATQQLLEIAALLGRDFAPALLARVAESDLATVAGALEEAERFGLIGAVSPATGRCRFTHALIPETLADDLPALARARLHGRIAALLEPLVAAGTVNVDEVAAHAFAAAPVDGPEKAIAYALLAAERASARLGYEDAVRYYRRAVAFLDTAAVDGDARRRAEILLALGEAERRVGDATAARATLARAAAIAHAAGLAEPLARAALAFGAGVGGFWDQSGGTVDDERVAIVQQALVALGPEPTGLRAMLLVHLAGSLFWSTSFERRAQVEQLSRQAVAMATAAADPSVTLHVLATAHWTTWGPDEAARRLAGAAELVRRATDQNDPEVLLRARMYSAAHHFELGDVAAADREVERFADLAGEMGQLRQAWYVHVYRGMRAYLAGRFDEVERTAAQALALGESAQPQAAGMAFGALLTMLHREQGRVAATIGATREIALAAPGIPAWSCALASGLAESGDLDGARRELARLAENGFSILQRNFFWLYAMAHLARVCAVLDDATQAAVLYEMLAPYADRVAVAQHGVLSDGAVARPLGVLATVLERWDDAEQHFAAALALNERTGARIFVTATQYEHARMLLRRGAADDAGRARALLDAAAVGARQMGQVALLASIAQALGGATTSDAAPAPASSNAPSADDVATVRRVAGDWAIAHGGQTFELKDAVGVGYLLTLLRHPGKEIHVHDLVAGTGPGSARRTGDAGEMLDEQARAAYRSRLAELREELDEAESFNDAGRTERVQSEIESLSDELTRAVGLGGRPRRAASDVERARINVTRALRRVIDAIAARDPALGSDLERGLRTGIFCCYTPDPRLPVCWLV